MIDILADVTEEKQIMHLLNSFVRKQSVATPLELLSWWRELLESIFRHCPSKMPGLPSLARETTPSRIADQIHHQQSQVQLTATELLVAEQSLSIYCKPVEFYNILQRRATKNPSFLQRCLTYNILAKRKRLTSGSVLFNYKYYNNMLQKTEAIEDFSCPFCEVHCGSFNGLRHHLLSSHDLFNFEFLETDNVQAVNVSVRADNWISEVASRGVDSRLQSFLYRKKFKRPRKSAYLFQNVNRVHLCAAEADSCIPHPQDSHEDELQKGSVTYFSDSPMNDSFSKDEKPEVLSGQASSLSRMHKLESNDLEDHIGEEYKETNTSGPDTSSVSAAAITTSISNCCTQPVCGTNFAPSTVIQFAKSQKPFVKCVDHRKSQSKIMPSSVIDPLHFSSFRLLQKRQFFHSRRAQPMALEQVFSNHDSEDDEDIADLRDTQMIDILVDVTEEKQIMHLWNSFVRKQRVLADGHIPWACETFSRHHMQYLIQAPALLRYWRLLMVKLWNHSLLDAHTMNKCNVILEKYQKEGLGSN